MKPKLLLAVFMSLSAFISSAQIAFDVTLNNVNICMGMQASTNVYVYNGTPPYVLTYTDGTNTLTATSSTSFFEINAPTAAPGTYSYTLVSIEDANAQSAVVNEPYTVVVNPLPNVQPVITQTPCTVMICASGAASYTADNNLTMCQHFTPEALGVYTYTIVGTDWNGCTNSTQAMIVVDYLPPIYSNQPVAAIDSAYCNDGSISLSLQGSEPFSVIWPFNNSTSPVQTGLAAGEYGVTVVDTFGCIYHTSYIVPLSVLPSDCGIVKGSVYYDMDEDCTISTGDLPSQFKVVTANPGNYIAISDLDGNYELRLDPGTYMLQETINYPNTGANCTAIHTVTVASGDVIDDINFMDTISGEIDLETFGYLTEVRPGFDFNFYPNVNNTLPVHDFTNVAAWFVIPQNVTLTSWNYAHTVSNDTVYFSASGNTFMSPAFFHATTVELGDTVMFCVGVEHSVLENNLLNNEQCIYTIAVGSYDPNDKTTFLHNQPTNGQIAIDDQTLDYVIRFQNTGTADAINVSVLDTIQDELNINSFQLISTSHTCNLVLMEDNVLKFDFPSIHLPDSTTDEPGSHGFIHYRIRQNSSNTFGTEIKNTAYIYFDFNEAVITNTTRDLIVQPWSVDELGAESVHLYPNPTEGKIMIAAASEIKSLKLYAINGQQLYAFELREKQAEIDLSFFNQGIYILEIETVSGISVRKLYKK